MFHLVSLGVILLDLHNSSDDTQPHPIIVKYIYIYICYLPAGRSVLGETYINKEMKTAITIDCFKIDWCSLFKIELES